jgi:hypothetical protein
MAEAPTDEYLARKMTRTELNELSDDEKRDRTKAKNRINGQKFRDKNPGNKIEYNRKWRENNPEKDKESKRKYIENNPEKIKESGNKYREENREKEKERHKKYREENPEKVKASQKKWSQTPIGKKSVELTTWKHRDIVETPEELERIYELRETQERCSSCDVKLTRDGVCSTQATMDHSHITNRFRQICCHSCNNVDSWKKYWVEGIFGGTKVPRGPDPAQ